ASALITPAHSAGTAVFSSLRQLATIASRSTVRVPIAAAAAIAAPASVGSPLTLESGTRFMLHATPGCTAVQPRERSAWKVCKLDPLRQVAFMCEIAEARELSLELQFD